MNESEEFLRAAIGRASFALKNANTLEQIYAIDFQLQENFKQYKQLKQKEDELQELQDESDHSDNGEGSPDAFNGGQE